MSKALDRWARIGLQEVELPSGIKVRGVLPNAVDLATRGLLPGYLRNVVFSLASAGEVKFSELSDDEADRFRSLLRHMGARFVREVQGEDGEWEPVELTGDELDSGTFPREDIAALEVIAGRQRTPEQVTAVSQFSRGLLEDEAVLAITEKEAGDTVNGWAEFRDDGSRPGTEQDSGTVQPTSLDHAGDKRPRRRASRGRGDGAAATA